jgi:hypothetical protein
MNETGKRDVRDKAVRLFTYLKELVSLRSTLAREYSDRDRILWLHTIPHEPQCYTAAWGKMEDASDRTWVELKKIPEPACPVVPSDCGPWVTRSSLFDSSATPTLRELIQKPRDLANGEQEDAPTEFLSLKDYPSIPPQWDQYLNRRWHPWAEIHQQWKRTHTWARVFTATMGEIFTPVRSTADDRTKMFPPLPPATISVMDDRAERGSA